MRNILTFPDTREMRLMKTANGVPPDTVTLERYREQMKRMFGDTNLPAVNYKGNLVEKGAL